MTEILTESFCERCGTRYTFESARPRMRLKGVKVLSRGLKNYVLSDDTSRQEAMASARSDTERELSSFQLDAFHKTFNFCMSCRQYTCPNCWNETEARCLTCAPHLGHEIMPAPFPDLAAAELVIADPTSANGANGSNGISHDAEMVEPDIEVDVAARLAMLTATGVVVEAPVEAPVEAVVEAPVEAVVEAPVEAVVEAPVEAVVEVPVEAVVEAPVEAVVEAPVEAVVEAPVEAVVEDHETAERIAAAAAAALVVHAAMPEEAKPHVSIGEKTSAQTAGLLRRFRPGQNLDAELEAYERENAAAVAASAFAIPTEGPSVTGGLDSEPGLEAEVEAIVTAPEVEAVVTAPEVEAAVAPTPVANDVVPQPTWRMVAPDPGGDGPAAKSVEPTATIPAAASAATSVPNDAVPQWPTRPGHTPSIGLPFLGRHAAPQGGLDALWAESSREVAVGPSGAVKPAGTIQPCLSCGLSLSSTARFCRRCGTPQAG